MPELGPSLITAVKPNDTWIWGITYEVGMRMVALQQCDPPSIDLSLYLSPSISPLVSLPLYL